MRPVHQHGTDEEIGGTMNKPTHIVWIQTSYLSEALDEFSRPYPNDIQWLMGLSDAQWHIDSAQYDPNNLADVNMIETPTKQILLKHFARGGSFEESSYPRIDEIPNPPLLVIRGCTEESEEGVQKHRGGGIIFGRYSMFYPGQSKYSGLHAGESGYSLDIPKLVQTVRDLLLDDSVTDALASRNLEQICASLERFNQSRDEPVLITEYLREALKTR